MWILSSDIVWEICSVKGKSYNSQVKSNQNILHAASDLLGSLWFGRMDTPFCTCLLPTHEPRPHVLTLHSYSPHNELSPRRLFQHMMPDFTSLRWLQWLQWLHDKTMGQGSKYYAVKLSDINFLVCERRCSCTLVIQYCYLELRLNTRYGCMKCFLFLPEKFLFQQLLSCLGIPPDCD